MSADHPNIRLNRRHLLATAALGACASASASPLDWLSPKKQLPANYKSGQPLLSLPKLAAVETLRVAYVANEALPIASPDLIERISRRTEARMAQLFGIAIKLTTPHAYSIQSVFDAFKKDDRQALDDKIIPFKTSELFDGQREILTNTMASSLQADSQPLAELLTYAAPYLVKPVAAPTFRGLAEALVQTHWTRLQAAKRAQIAPNQPLLGPEPYNEFSYWAALDQAYLPYEVIITNQPMISIEKHSAALHSALRGGVSNGVTSASGSARLGSYSVLSTYPMLSNDAWLLPLRGNQQTYTDEQAVDYAALILVHEIGHQLLHLGHPFGRKNCVMSPTPALDFAAWASMLSDSCRVGSNGMVAGEVKFPAPRHFRAEQAVPKSKAEPKK